jgi:hypothetical protein
MRFYIIRTLRNKIAINRLICICSEDLEHTNANE